MLIDVGAPICYVSAMRVLLLTPPLIQLNTPYPATAFLTGFLRSQGIDAIQADPAIELFHRLFCRPGLRAISEVIIHTKRGQRSVRSFLEQANLYQERVESVVRFLQGLDAPLAHRIRQPGFLPEGPRFKRVDEMERSGSCLISRAIEDQSRFLATLFIQDIADAIREGIDPRFELFRYAEKLALSASTFDPLLSDLNRIPTYVDACIDAIAESLTSGHSPDVVGLTVPFPGCLYGALRIARVVKRANPNIRIVMGGGYVNTELRSISDARIFDFVDFLTLDDGERPLLGILHFLSGRPSQLVRTFIRDNAQVVYKNGAPLPDDSHRDVTPTYDGLSWDRYVSLVETPNPMHQLWSEGRWVKLMLAHGCYWKRCAFCDTSLDYINRFEPMTACQIVDKMEKLIAETGLSDFHFVDEAAPPSLLGKLSEEIIRRALVVSWWTNIRFERHFDSPLTAKMAAAGCIAVSGGLEVASNRLLSLMEKGVTVEQVASVTRHFSRAGIMVHAYLMYGFPTQTEAETIDSLERVRQLFCAGCIQSAYWHRFSATAHSPVGRHPERFGIRIVSKVSPFANNDLEFVDESGVDHDRLGPGLNKALYNYMHGVGFEYDVRDWFDYPVPKPRVPRHWAESVIRGSHGLRESSPGLNQRRMGGSLPVPRYE